MNTLLTACTNAVNRKLVLPVLSDSAEICSYYKNHPDVEGTTSCPEPSILEAKMESRKRDKEELAP